ncbi:MAG: hypothetical protein P1S46_01315 [bacterium]|nr:hypothetical protein [bacterium]MDT8394952.1 hypothetical protein [bacterium]
MMKPLTSSILTARTVTICLTVLLILSLIPVSSGTFLEAALGKAGLDQVNAAARGYLQDQRDQAIKGFLVLSALKVGLAVLRSSEIGLVLNVRIGDLAIAVYDYVNFAWKVMLAAVAWFYLADFFLDLSAKVDTWFLWAALICFSAAGWLALLSVEKRVLKNLLQRTGVVAAVFSLILYVALPLGFIGAGWVSANVTGTAIVDANRFLEDLQDDMPSLQESGKKSQTSAGDIRTPSVTVPFPYDGTDPSRVVVEDEVRKGGFGGLVEGIVYGQKLRKFKNYLESRSSELASVILRQTAAYLFNIVLLPLLMVLSLYMGGKYVVSFAPARPVSLAPGTGSAIPDLTEAIKRLERRMGKTSLDRENPEP